MTDVAGGTEQRTDTPRLVVCIGSSAGGLAALEAFFGAVEPGTGCAYVTVSHTAPSGETLLPEILARHAKVKVALATAGMRLEPDTAYVVAGRGAVVRGGVLEAPAPEPLGGLAHPIDRLMGSLAADLGARAVGVILSGSGTDGTLGVQAIRGAGGLTLAQSPETAEFAMMPASAIASGEVDAALPPERMPAMILAFAAATSQPVADLDEGMVGRILMALRGQSGHDFSGYKRGTVVRRVQRRMSVQHLTSAAAYLELLRASREECDALLRELLIGVTAFFRDAAAFDVLKTAVLPQIVARLAPDQPLRAWVVACATGEEAYSVAIVAAEVLAEARERRPVQIFATDLDARAVEHARQGIYPSGIAADVGPARLERFFVRENDHYRVKKEIREMVVFATHNLVADPPFTRVDLVTCRNLLIYFDTALQQVVLPMLHYALSPGGVLFLGSAETLGALADGFEPIDKRWNLYRRKELAPAAVRARFVPMRARTTPSWLSARPAVPAVSPVRATVGQTVNQLLVDALLAPTVVVDARGEIVHVHGRTGSYLEPAPGEPGMNVLRMARPGLAGDLSAALHEAVGSAARVVRRGVRVSSNGGERRVDVRVTRLEPPGEQPLFAVSFEPSSGELEPAPAPPAHSEASVRTSELERDLRSVHESLRVSAEQYESANEELKSSNEELQSTNEELQSTNEELETAKEEQQSLNEELQTVNAELRDKIAHLSEAHDDMRNLLHSTGIATLFLDTGFRIKRFTPAATQVVSLIPTDVGRPISDLVSKVQYDGLVDDAREVVRTLVPKQGEVQSKDGTWYHTTITPYRTANDTIDGVVLTFVDITRRKRSEEGRERERDVVRRVVRACGTPMVILDRDLRIDTANAAFGALLGRPANELEERFFLHLGPDWDVPALREPLASPPESAPVSLVIPVNLAGGERASVSLRIEKLDTGDPSGRILVSVLRVPGSV